MTAATRSPRFIRHRRRSDRSLRRPHFFQQPARGGFALRRDPLLPPSAKVGKNAVQTCGLKIRSRPAHGILLFCISRAVTLMQTSLNVELLLRLSPLPLKVQNIELRTSTFQSKSGSAQRKKSMQHLGVVATAPTTRGTFFHKSSFRRRAGSLETCGFKQPFWSLLGLRPKVTRARRRGTALVPPEAMKSDPRPQAQNGLFCRRKQ